MQGFNTACVSPALSFRRRVCISVLVACAALSLSACDVWVSADKRVQRAQTHLANGQYRPAMTELKTALESEPDHLQARLVLAELSLWLGDLDGAEKEISRALALGAGDAQARPLQYELLLARKNFDELGKLLAIDRATPAVRRLLIEARAAGARGDEAQVEEKLKLALEAAPDDAEALLESARLAAARGQLQPALELPERVSDAGEVHARALFLKGAVLMTQGEHSQAHEAFSRAHEAGKMLPAPEQLAIAAARTEASLALNDVEAADQSLAAVAAWGQQSLVVHYLRARVAMLKNDYVAAVAECQRALRIAPEHAQSQILLAAAHLSQGSMEQAQDVLTRLLAANPENLAARKLLAQVYLGRNQPSQAQRVLNSAAVGVEGDSELDWLMGAALMKAGSMTTGLQHLERSVAAAPKDMSRRIDLAGAYIAARMPEKAAELLTSVPPDSSAAPRAKVLQVLATAAGKPRAEARREVEALVARHPDDAALTSVAGAYLVGTGEPAKGRELLERAIALDPKNVDARLSLARMEAGTRNVSAAERWLLDVIKLDSEHQVARVALAELAWGVDDRQQSRKWLEEAISVNPGAVEARLRLAQIAFIEGDAPRARSLLDQALSVATDRKTVLTATGQVLARAGLNDEALARFREASAAGHADAVLEAARIHVDLDQPGKARALLESALKSRANWREAEQMLVMVDARDGQVQRAIERAKRLAGDTSPGALRVLEGDLYALSGQRDAAIAAYEAAQKLQPGPVLAIKIFNAKRSSDAAGAERSLTQWLERAPGDSDVRRVLAAHYESAGQTGKAIEQYERLLSADRIDPTMLNNLAWALHERGDPRALELAQRAYTASPHYAEIS
ncbi:MAG: XrtA/PEP-CTERM system TPR-repeat protein PrsT, partial [Steroidobacter sp.]